MATTSPILESLKRAREAAAARHATAQQGRRKIEAQIEAHEARLAAPLDASAAGPLGLLLRDADHKARERLREELKALVQLLQAYDREHTEPSRAALQSASTKERLFEKYLERLRKAHLRTERRREQRTSDEIAGQAWLRRGSPR